MKAFHTEVVEEQIHTASSTVRKLEINNENILRTKEGGGLFHVLSSARYTTMYVCMYVCSDSRNNTTMWSTPRVPIQTVRRNFYPVAIHVRICLVGILCCMASWLVGVPYVVVVMVGCRT